MNRLLGIAARVRRTAAYLRLRPFDSSTAEGRAAERYRRAAWSTVAVVAARGLGITVSLVSIPLTIGYLGTERYGLWVTISSLTSVLTFADLGLGYGVLNAIAGAKGRDDRSAAAIAVTSGSYLLAAVAAAMILVLAAVYGVVPWAELYNVSSPLAAAEAGPASAVFVICLAINLPLALVVRIQYGLQEGYVANAWAAAGSVITLLALVAAIAAQAGLPWLVLAMVGGPALATLLSGVVLFARRHPDLRPSRRLASWPVARELMRLGLLFSITQLSLTVAYHSDVYIAARVIGPEAAAQYAVLLRLFFLAPQVASLSLAALWPAYGEAIARGDVGWVRGTVIRSTAVSVILVASVSLVLLLFIRQLLDLWVGPVFQPELMMVLGMAAWSVVSTAFNAISMPLNAASRIRFQAITSAVMAVVSVLASLALAQAFGIAGIIWGTLLAYLVCSAGPYLWNLRQLLRSIEPRTEAANA